MPRGRVAWYSANLGHGFIIPEDGGPKAFVRHEDIKAGEEEEMRGEEVRPISGIFTSAEGQEVSFGVLGREPDPDEYRWIVLEDGQAKGAKKGAHTGSTSGYIDPGSL